MASSRFSILSVDGIPVNQDALQPCLRELAVGTILVIQHGWMKDFTATAQVVLKTGKKSVCMITNWQRGNVKDNTRRARHNC